MGITGAEQVSVVDCAAGFSAESAESVENTEIKTFDALYEGLFCPYTIC